MELVKINHEEYGLQESKAKEISAMFKPMLDRMVELEDKYNEVVVLPISEETCGVARDLRLEYVKTRTGTAKIHKELKAFYLQGGRFVDGWKNAQLMASQGIENKLSMIENHYAIQEKERIAKLQEKRSKALKKFDLDIVPENLGEMDTVMWNNYLTGTKVNYDKKIEEERKFLKEQAEKEQARKDEEERVRKESERLLAEAKEKERKRDEADAKRRVLEEKERKEREEKERQAETARADERKKIEAQLEKQRKEREVAEAKLKAIEDEKERKRLAEEARVQDDLNKGDSVKVQDLILDLNKLGVKYEFKSSKNKAMYNNVNILLTKVMDYIKSKT